MEENGRRFKKANMLARGWVAAEDSPTSDRLESQRADPSRELRFESSSQPRAPYPQMRCVTLWTSANFLGRSISLCADHFLSTFSGMLWGLSSTVSWDPSVERWLGPLVGEETRRPLADYWLASGQAPALMNESGHSGVVLNAAVASCFGLTLSRRSLPSGRARKDDSSVWVRIATNFHQGDPEEHYVRRPGLGREADERNRLLHLRRGQKRIPQLL
jgi:hypothetical protein